MHKNVGVTNLNTRVYEVYDGDLIVHQDIKFIMWENGLIFKFNY